MKISADTLFSCPPSKINPREGPYLGPTRAKHAFFILISGNWCHWIREKFQLFVHSKNFSFEVSYPFPLSSPTGQFMGNWLMGNKFTGNSWIRNQTPRNSFLRSKITRNVFPRKLLARNSFPRNPFAENYFRGTESQDICFRGIWAKWTVVKDSS